MTSLNHTIVASFIKSLLNNKCSNYGYDYKDFKRISSQRSKARKELEVFYYYNPTTVLERLSQESRLSIEDTEVIVSLQDGSKILSIEPRAHYNVGQSSNEEITNLMRRLVNPKAKWVK